MKEAGSQGFLPGDWDCFKVGLLILGPVSQAQRVRYLTPAAAQQSPTYVPGPTELLDTCDLSLRDTTMSLGKRV